MRWKNARRSENVEDRRGSRGKAVAAVGGGGILVALIAMFFPQLQPYLGLVSQVVGGGKVQQGEVTVEQTPEEAELADFVARVLGSTEDTWARLFREQVGKDYRAPGLVLFRDNVQSACGVQGASVGPFYCPGDNKCYIDLSFYKTLKDQLGAGGDFAQAYVIAHEVGHHIQNLLGTSRKVHGQQARLGQGTPAANDLSVRLELQADFYAGVWAHYAAKEGLVEPGDFEEALNAAAKIGDDALQRRSGQAVRVESFTHGSSEQRQRWFRKGLESGDMRQGDTFAANPL